MKTDYRGICCIVAWLCCAAVQCRIDTSHKYNLNGNGLEDFGREYDDAGDQLTIMGTAYDILNTLADGGGGDGEECGEDCEATGGKCVPIGSEPDKKQCECPTDTQLETNKCIVQPGKCKDKFPDCESTGGSCLSKPGEIICNCPEDTTLDATNNKCSVQPEKCKDKFPDCESTGGSCLSKPGKIICSCPEDTTFSETDNKCLVQKGKCAEKFPDCESTGGSCLSTPGKIICSCPADTTIHETDNKCLVDQKKCVALYPNCESSGGTCLSSPAGIKCSCPTAMAFDEVNKKCLACDCGDGVESCKFDGNNTICSCKEKYGLKDKKCAACDCGEGVASCSFDNAGVQTCVCKAKFSLKEGKCHECDCGDGSTACKLEGDKKVCTCKNGYADKEGTCTDCSCGSESLGCSFRKDEKMCECKPRYGDKGGTCTACECGNDAKTCVFIGDKKICACKDKYAEKKGKCEKCNCGDAVSNGCSFKEDVKTCDCIKDYAHVNNTCKMDYCQVKCGCEVGGCVGDTDCEGNKFVESETTCICVDDKKFDARMKKCRTTCEIKDKKSNCNNGGECTGEKDKFCKCLNGTSGDACGDVDACNEGGKYAKCDGDKGTCLFNLTSKSAVCLCEVGKELDKSKNYCVDKFCVEGNCRDNSTCEYDKDTHTGYCMCSKGKYYDYQTNLCKDPNKCLLKKTACGGNEVCDNGECKCLAPYEKDGEKCIKKFCKQNTCFSGAKCDEEKSACICEEGKIFTGSKCEDKKCILEAGYEKKCPCPRLMDRDGDKCVPKSGKACETDCGFGLCVNNNCRCFDGAELVNKTCVLQRLLCPTKKLVNGSRSQCLCENKYKPAKDGKLCDLVTCDDESAKSFCTRRGATCRMKWIGTPQFECVCPDGYVMDSEREICTDPCSLQKNIDACLSENKFCFNSISKENVLTGDCRCPPPFSNAAGCRVLDKFVYLISGISVAKKNYETKSGINYVLLNTDLTQSLAQTYSSAVFDYGYLFDFEVNENVITCSVWVRFKKNATEELQRIPFQAKQFSEVCKDCDTDMYVWPPSLLLSNKGLDKVTYINLDLCSPAVKDKLCGSEAGCNDKAGCYCPRGFRMLEYTARLTADNRKIQRCEATTKNDLDECKMGTHKCPKNTKCLKIPGDYICECEPGYWKENNYNKKECQDMCAKNPCAKGKCTMQKDSFNCECDPGYAGSRCNLKDVNFASAKKSTVVVGAVLGTILIVGIIAFFLYYRKIRKSTYSEDFMPAAPSHAEMTERRPVRGVVNKSYE